MYTPQLTTMASSTEEFLAKVLGLPHDKVQELKHTSPQDILGWTKETCPVQGIWTRVLKNKEDVLKLKLIQPLQKWADKWKTREFLRRATPREILWTLNENPFYPCIAYNVSYDACSDLGIPCPNSSLMAYAYACERIRKGGSASKIEIDMMFPNSNILHVEPIDLSTHPLYGLDLEKTSKRELMDKAGIQGVGEFKRALNTLMMEGTSSYIKKPVSSASMTNELAGYIKSYLQATPSTSMPLLQATSTSLPCPPL